ncbi:MAG: flagellar type III secretion system pore protein FliP [Candidatus Magnetoovum sp. WYHC-5]|nr:flagellar type III secretion system pore protein FliP [Candidatus Magnetoovum sp. WYHC-5]
MEQPWNLDHPLIGVFLAVTFLSFLPAVLIMFTSFTRIIIVLSFLRQAIGGAQIPPNQVIIGLSLFMTLFIMSPTLDAVAKVSITPFMEEKIDIVSALKNAEEPAKKFMLQHTRQKDIALFLRLSNEDNPAKPTDVPLKVLVPAFSISELKTAFIMGFLIYLPFIIIDMVVASVMLSMGMMMVPPVMVSMPFKLLLFVLVDGWNIIMGSLARSFQ